MEKSKTPLSDWTLGEAKNKCGSLEKCGSECPFYNSHNGCVLANRAAKWPLAEMESIRRKPKLTDAELSICNAMGAKWVSRDSYGMSVKMWSEKPTAKEPSNSEIVYIIEAGRSLLPYLGYVRGALFPSVRPGDCICVKEIGDGD